MNRNFQMGTCDCKHLCEKMFLQGSLCLNVKQKKRGGKTSNRLRETMFSF